MMLNMVILYSGVLRNILGWLHLLAIIGYAISGS